MSTISDALKMRTGGACLLDEKIPTMSGLESGVASLNYRQWVGDSSLSEMHRYDVLGADSMR